MIVGYDYLTKWVCATFDQRYAIVHGYVVGGR